MQNRLYLILFCAGLAFACHGDVYVLDAQSREDASHDYFVQLLQFSLDKSTPEYPADKVKIITADTTTQGRNLRLLKEDYIDVLWTGTSQKREQELLPVRIPLFQGMLGYRIAIIHKDNLDSFKSLNEVQLKQKLMCQGAHWPDSDILEFNQYQVVRVARYELMFKMLNQKRCDLFPRAIYEGYAELTRAKSQYPDLVMLDDFLLHYDFPMYFFVNKQNTRLAQQIEFGLRKALKDGSWLEWMKKHPMTAPLFPLTKWQDKRFYRLLNPTLPGETPVDDDLLWLKLNKK